MLVGSGNLTFGAWGGNCEILEHLHAGFVLDAIADAANFFDLLPASERIRYGAAKRCAVIAADLRRSIRGRPRQGDVRWPAPRKRSPIGRGSSGASPSSHDRLSALSASSWSGVSR
jgi:hypothetical protein